MDIEIETLACLTFQGQVPEIVSTGSNPFLHPHAQSCTQCRGLLEDIERISRTAARVPLRNE